MAIIELFSKRQAQQAVQKIDVYVYDRVPESLRNQVAYLWDDTLGDVGEYSNEFRGKEVREAYKWIWHTFRRAHGMSKDDHTLNYRKELIEFFAECSDDKALDLIELSFQVI